MNTLLLASTLVASSLSLSTLSSYTINRHHESLLSACTHGQKIYESSKIYICLERDLSIDIRTKGKREKEEKDYDYEKYGNDDYNDNNDERYDFEEIKRKANCGQGTFKSKVTKSCLPCPPELTSKFNSNKCNIKMNVCDKGTFKSSESSECLPCPKGYTSKMGAKSCDYKESNNRKKVNGCGEGTFSKDDVCLPCPSGKTSKVNSYSCDIDLDDDEYDNYGHSNTCGAGTYYDRDTEMCLSCKPGYKSKNGATKCIKKKNDCRSGSFFNEDSDSCEKCKEGEYSQDGATKCKINTCGAGTYLEISDNTCYVCPKGRSSLPHSLRCGVMIDEKPFPEPSTKSSIKSNVNVVSSKTPNANVIISKTVRYEPSFKPQIPVSPVRIIPLSHEAPIITGPVNGFKISTIGSDSPFSDGIKITELKNAQYVPSFGNNIVNTQQSQVQVETIKSEPVRVEPISSKDENLNVNKAGISISSPFKVTKAFEMPPQNNFNF